MRLVTFADPAGRQRLGMLDGDVVGEISTASVSEFLLLPTDDRRSLVNARLPSHPASAVRILAPLPRPPRNVFCVGKNYHDHAAEFHASGFDDSAHTPQPAYPVFFTKATTSVVGPGDAIRADLDPTRTTDFEGELAVVIGTGGRDIPAGCALDHVFGYTAFNDVTARELQRRHGQWFLGKSIDTFGPMGPCIVTADEVGDPRDLKLTVAVNGEIRQSARVSDLIFDIATLIECLSSAVTLQPGDVIATGTPAGVGVGHSPPRYLVPGDTVTVGIDRIGELTNPVTGTPAR
jgi:2-keto-4-pentenoate hydratase/2-oxohepta-3-ene-1,7-dioic acid hydratase in catechol pathway